MLKNHANSDKRYDTAKLNKLSTSTTIDELPIRPRI